MNPIETICKTAKAEASYTHPKSTNWFSSEESEELVFKPFKQPRYKRIIVDLRDEPVSLDRFISFDPNVKCTLGTYTIQYVPMHDAKRNPKFPFLIGQDLVRMRILCSGPAHWERLAERIPEIGWLNRNTNISRSLFGICKKHPGLCFRFSVDYPKYCDKIEARAAELGIDIDHKPLVTYTWTKAVIEKYKDIELAPARTKADYQAVLDEVNSGISTEEKL